jgi:hypothetical protein
VFNEQGVILDQTMINEWTQLKVTLPVFVKNNHNPDSEIDTPANTDSYIHLVTETTVKPKIFLSEKTWKPIASEQLFLVFGNVGIISYLRDQGVDVFDDLIDHSYDNEQNWENRLIMIHEQLRKLINMDLEFIYKDTEQRRRNNQQKFFMGEFDKKFYQTIMECINTQS